ncbi:MAG: ATP-binding protein [Nitrospirota bacterium]|nr:ATP-binding protein [Nitrospirota bacterium]MDP2383949.1 ATP-binding protein [Nitrospirota bacterium]MDP3598463.1 ATP-binding protein [Nitrospirota bacterium]
MEDFEKLGVFYLGRPYDPAKKKPKPGWLLYDSKDLVTHAVCVGMTGSGKTGLCLGLLEEAAIDGIPAIVIDPKGDLANLMLTFPQLRGEDFAPWINEDDARKNGLSPGDFATQQAALWKRGLGEWGQSGERIQKLKDAADVVVYTPGSNAGIPVSILKSFAAPSQDILDDVELLRERVGTTTTSLLGLIGVEADPIKSREHILLSTILDQAWRKGQDLDLAALIQQIQTPPISKVGVLDLDSFYPSKDRFALAMQLNNLLAAPGFSAWLEGEALDVGKMLYGPAGKPRIAIFSIAHLSDAERMFFVTLLLSQTLGWIRGQSGTTSLRAILYMDEIFGYFPPVANPPSKAPLLTLLKQARAYGLGVVLATQNPVDLDYKGLANTGTWFIGRLQTERDKARVLEGLEGAASSSGNKFDKQKMEQLLAGLGSRVFLLNNVHEDAPVVFQTRWTLSYLRGPLTRTQIKMLMSEAKGKGLEVGIGDQDQTGQVASSSPSPRAAGPSPGGTRPLLPPDVPQQFIPIRGAQPGGSRLVYQPMLLGGAHVRFSDSKAGIDVTQDVTVLAPITEGAVPVDWDHATEAALALSDLEQVPVEGAAFEAPPVAAGKAKNYEAWGKDFSGWLFRTQNVELLRSPSTKESSRPGESERDFRVRLQQTGREQRDAQSDSLRKRYAPKIAALQDRIRRAEHMVERQQTESRSSQLQAAISFGATILGAFMGRKTISASTIGKATTAIRGAGRAIKESQDVGQAEDNAAALQQQLVDLEAQFKAETESLAAATDPLTEALDRVSLKPTKANIVVRLVALAWTPYWRDGQGTVTPAWI